MRAYLSRLNIKLSDADKQAAAEDKPVQTWVQLFRLGQWKHPRYGPLKFTESIFDGFVKSFNDNVRKVELALDQDHTPEKGAAAWIKSLENRGESGLWALVEWTKHGFQLVSDGVYKYLSGDFDYEWKDEETGKTYKNVLFGAALTNRPFIKGMSPINLSEFREELESDAEVRNTFQLAEDIIKLKEGTVKSDAEILAAKEEELTPEEKTKKQELLATKKKEDETVALSKKKLAERAKACGLADDAAEDEIIKAEKEKEEKDKEEKEKKLAEEIKIKNANLAKRAVAAGLKENATLDEIEKAEQEAVAKQRQMEKNKTLSEEISKTLSEGNIPRLEKQLAELKDNKADSLTVKLLEDAINAQKQLAEEKMKNAKSEISQMLKGHFLAGKLTTKERDMLQSILCSELETSRGSIKLSEKNASGEQVEVTKSLKEIMDGLLNDRPAIVELAELAAKELAEPPKPKEEDEEEKEKEAKDIGKRVAQKVTGKV
jgi:hypothetical protein